MSVLTDNQIEYLKNCKLLGLDIEGKDPELEEKGPGTHRGDGYICGTAVGDEEVAAYLSLAHPDTQPEERERNRAILKDILKSPSEKVGANVLYDLEWLTHEGFKVNGKLHDVQYAAPLLDEYQRSYSLENLAKAAGLQPKATNVLKEYCDAMNWKGKPVKHIWRMPTRVAAEYALVDIDLPLKLFAVQRKELELQKLMDVYELEIALIPVLLRMRQNGVRLNLPLLERTIAYVTDKRFEAQERIYTFAKEEFNIGSSNKLAKLFDAHGIPYPCREPTKLMREKGRTKGNPNLDKDTMELLSERYPICKEILHYRYYSTLINTFLYPYSTMQVNGRLYCQFHPLRSDKYGTVSGRFSSSKPNLQQVSAKSEEEDEASDELLTVETPKGQLIRALFLPEEGCRWRKLDYSQIEYRIIAHYASGKGADDLRAIYNADPTTDFHAVIQEKTGFERRTTKRLNFGAAYGMGLDTTAQKFRWSLDEAENYIREYHSQAPYIKPTRKKVASVAQRRGFIYTILGRKARTHPSRKLHSMFNRLIQGTAADVMKKAMVDAEKKGLFDVLPLHLTVHDELDVSVPPTKEAEEAHIELKETMENTIKFDVPLLVDSHEGSNWAEAD